jgi:hypothetical protein
MASSINITNIYESYLELSFIDRKNFNPKIDPTLIVGSFIPCNNIDFFYTDSLLYLHLYASLYYELYYFIKSNNNDIVKFKECVDSLKIHIQDAALTDAYRTTCIGYLNTANNTFKFSLANLKTNYKTKSGYFNYTQSEDNTEALIITYDNIVPVLDNISTFTFPDTFTSSSVFGLAAGTTTQDFNKNFTVTTSGSELSAYNTSSRYNMIQKIIKGILTQNHENIMSYLLYYIVYYHIIVYNICIQNEININYLHNVQSTNASDSGTKLLALKTKLANGSLNSQLAFNSLTTYGDNLTAIKNLLSNLTSDLNTIQSRYLASGSSAYIDNKSKYADKIEVLNEIKTEFDRIQNELNYTIKEYNKYIKNFQNVKSYASFIIVLLIAIIILTIVITIVNSISPNFKNYYYIIAFIVLSFMTFIYYDKFKYINFYENFTAIQISTGVTSSLPIARVDNISSCINNTFNLSDTSTYNLPARNSHKVFVNSLVLNLNTYNENITKLMNTLRTNIYTTNYSVFTKDGNTYLYNLYIEKKNQNEANRIRKVSLANMLDTMKRHIVYLFNIILSVSLLTIVLLLGLILFSNFPFYLNYIIVLCVILIIIIIILFINSIVQPTRMLVNKYYWANKNPSKFLLAKV